MKQGRRLGWMRVNMSREEECKRQGEWMGSDVRFGELGDVADRVEGLVDLQDNRHV